MTPEEETTLRDTTYDAVVYKQIAAYMAQCHIATAYAFLSIKSTSAHEKKRLRDIVVSCKRMLEGTELPPQFGSGMYYANDKIKDAVERAKKFLEHYP
jgi:hypothetical protein